MFAFAAGLITGGAAALAVGVELSEVLGLALILVAGIALIVADIARSRAGLPRTPGLEDDQFDAEALGKRFGFWPLAALFFCVALLPGAGFFWIARLL